MNLDMLSIHQFIGVNNLKEVSDPVTFEKGNIPTPNGLLSTEIFGTTVTERSLTFAYVDLKGYYITPYIYKTLKRLDSNIESLVNGTKKFTLDEKGHLMEDPEKGQTGIKFLFKVWDKLKWKRNDSSIRSERIDIVTSVPKNKIFTHYWVISPAYYRDVNLSTTNGKVSHHEVNDLYSRLIRLAKTTQTSQSFDFQLSATEARLQETLVEIYDLYKSRLEKKNGLIRKSLLGRTIDYGARAVITAPDFTSFKAEGMPINSFRSGVPLAMTCSLFTPFIIHWVSNFFRREFESYGKMYPIYKKNKDGHMEIVERLAIEDPMSHFNDEYIRKALDRFVKAPSDRFNKIEVPVKDPKYKGRVFMMFTPDNAMSEDIQSPLASRPLTWTDVFYQAAVDATSNKHVWTTRYPLLDHFGMFVTRIHVLSTVETVPMFVSNRSYSHYPKIDFNLSDDELSVAFQDSGQIANTYLHGLGGDYDGDQVTFKGVFSQEANEEAEKLMNSPANFLSIYGGNMRKTTNEGIQAIYQLTRKED